MHSIACGRGSSSSSRYVDMNVEVDAEGNDDTVDHPSISFSNIQREEMNVLKEYIHDILIPAMKLDAAKSGEGANTVASRESPDGETSDENSEDEDDLLMLDSNILVIRHHRLLDIPLYDLV